MYNKPGKLLTKSRFMAGLQCPRYLWLTTNQPKSLPAPDLVTRNVFDQGHQVGELAKKLFPDGVDLAGLGFQQSITETARRLKYRQPVFEAAIRAGQLYARIDILAPAANGGWDIVEVKSSTSVKEEHTVDVAFQKHVAVAYGLPVNRCRLIHLNRDFVKNGDIDPNDLFIVTDITDEVSELSGGIADSVEDMLNTISGDCPDPFISRACNYPHICPLKPECWQVLPEHPVTSLYRGGEKTDELLRMGVTGITDIPAGFSLNEKQSIQLECVRTGRDHRNRPELRDFLKSLPYPHYYLDFETFNTAIPLFDGTRPYQQVPFQFSLHTAAAPEAPLEHRGFLYRGQGDPRPEFISALREALGDGGRIIVYNQSFEQDILERLADAFPEYREWVADVIDRMADLLVPFRAFHYYHPNQRGSASLKNVLPAVTGTGYDGLNIANGQVASIRYFNAVYGNKNEAMAELFADLEEYCGQDTEGMAWIMDRLKILAEDEPTSTNDMA
jgi:hypothetical protein